MLFRQNGVRMPLVENLYMDCEFCHHLLWCRLVTQIYGMHTLCNTGKGLLAWVFWKQRNYHGITNYRGINWDKLYKALPVSKVTRPLTPIPQKAIVSLSWEIAQILVLCLNLFVDFVLPHDLMLDRYSVSDWIFKGKKWCEGIHSLRSGHCNSLFLLWVLPGQVSQCHVPSHTLFSFHCSSSHFF